jgi:hypothetical protein
MQGSGLVEAVPGDARLEVPDTGGSEPGSTTTTQATVEAVEAKTSIRIVGRADVERAKEVVEAPPEAGQEAARPEEPQPQQDRPAEPAIEAERGTVVPQPIIQAMAPIVEVLAPPQGSALALIDLIVDDSPADKGKQKVDVETAEVSDRAGTSAALGGDQSEASARWPNFAGLALVRAEEELPRWGRSTLEFRDASNLSAEPFFALDDKDEVQHWEYLEGLRKHSL